MAENENSYKITTSTEKYTAELTPITSETITQGYFFQADLKGFTSTVNTQRPRDEQQGLTDPMRRGTNENLQQIIDSTLAQIRLNNNIQGLQQIGDIYRLVSNLSKLSQDPDTSIAAEEGDKFQLYFSDLEKALEFCFAAQIVIEQFKEQTGIDTFQTRMALTELTPENQLVAYREAAPEGQLGKIVSLEGKALSTVGDLEKYAKANHLQTDANISAQLGKGYQPAQFDLANMPSWLEDAVRSDVRNYRSYTPEKNKLVTTSVTKRPIAVANVQILKEGELSLPFDVKKAVTQSNLFLLINLLKERCNITLVETASMDEKGRLDLVLTSPDGTGEACINLVKGLDLLQKIFNYEMKAALTHDYLIFEPDPNNKLRVLSPATADAARLVHAKTGNKESNATNEPPKNSFVKFTRAFIDALKKEGYEMANLGPESHTEAFGIKSGLDFFMQPQTDFRQEITVQGEPIITSKEVIDLEVQEMPYLKYIKEELSYPAQLESNFTNIVLDLWKVPKNDPKEKVYESRAKEIFKLILSYTGFSVDKESNTWVEINQIKPEDNSIKIKQDDLLRLLKTALATAQQTDDSFIIINEVLNQTPKMRYPQLILDSIPDHLKKQLSALACVTHSRSYGFDASIIGSLGLSEVELKRTGLIIYSEDLLRARLVPPFAKVFELQSSKSLRMSVHAQLFEIYHEQIKASGNNPDFELKVNCVLHLLSLAKKDIKTLLTDLPYLHDYIEQVYNLTTDTNREFINSKIRP